jgi:hypothetical protein
MQLMDDDFAPFFRLVEDEEERERPRVKRKSCSATFYIAPTSANDDDLRRRLDAVVAEVDDD